MRQMTKLRAYRGNINRLFEGRIGRFVGVLAAVAVICIASLVFAAKAHNHTPVRRPVDISGPIDSGEATAVVRPAAAKPQSGPVPARVEVQVVTARPRGFEPSDITRPAGIFLLAVDNRSGLDALSLRLDREAGNRVHQQLVPRKKLDWRGAFDLTPGRYVLTEANNPDWVCHITITAH